MESTANSELISWGRTDLEQRFGLASGKFTDVNALFSAAGGLLLTVAFFGAVAIASRHATLAPVLETFHARGPIPYLIVFFFFWSLFFLILKRRKLRAQEQVLTLALLPHDPDFSLTRAGAREALHKIETMVDSPRNFLLLNRVIVALSNLRNIGNVSQVSTILEAQGRLDEEQVESSYHLVSGFTWAIPVFGFIGTVLGLAEAMRGFGATLSQTETIDAVRDSLTLVVSGLSTAFDTTLLGLAGAVVLQIFATFIRRKEFHFLDACNDYCQQQLIGRLRIQAED
jgi:biopolymer transport protein ExbB/TolQ